MIVYIILLLIIFIALGIAGNRRSQEIGVFLARKEAGDGYLLSGRSKNEIYTYKTIYSIIAFALLFFMWVLTAFRGPDIGNDTRNYIYYFEKIRTTGIEKEYRFEYGFQLFCLIVGLFTNDAQVFLIVCATICYIGIGVYIFKYSKNILISAILVFTFCFSIFTSALRQNFAMILCLYAYHFIKNKKLIRAFILICLATTFHKTAVLCFIFFLYKFIGVGLKINLVLIAVTIVLAMSGALNNILVNFGWYGIYAHGKYAGTGWVAVAYNVLQGLFFYWFMYTAYKKRIRHKQQIVLINCIVLIFLNSLGFAVNLFTRASQYFILPIITEFPNACYEGKVKEKSLWLSVVCLALIGYFLASFIMRPEWNSLYPYSFCW